MGTPTTDMVLFKVILNSVDSTPRAKFMIIDLANFYLDMPMKRPKYVKLPLTNIPTKVVREYKLLKKATKDVFLYVKVQKEM